MAARHDPGFVRHARSKWAKGRVVTANFEDAQVLLFLLRQDVTENAALFAFEILASGAKFVEHATRHKSGCGQLGSRVLELLPCGLAMILEDADVLEAGVALQVLKPRSGQTQKLFRLCVARIPEMSIVARIFEQ